MTPARRTAPCAARSRRRNVDKNGVLMADDIKTQIDWYSSHGMIDGKLDAKDVVNTSFLEEAMKK